jgi:putative oxidoreductase
MATKSRGKEIALWILAGLLAVQFTISGVIKLIGVEMIVTNFARWGYPSWFRLFIGAAELAGAVGLLIPKLRALAASGLALVMAGAVYTHIRAGEGAETVMPAVLFALTALLAYARRPSAA